MIANAVFIWCASEWRCTLPINKEHEVMTGSVPTIALTSISPSLRHPSATAVVIGPRQTRKPVVATIAAAWQHLQLIDRIWRERRLLAGLSDHALKDIGLNRADVEREISRSPFDLPRHRNR